MHLATPLKNGDEQLRALPKLLIIMRPSRCLLFSTIVVLLEKFNVPCLLKVITLLSPDDVVISICLSRSNTGLISLSDVHCFEAEVGEFGSEDTEQ